MPRDSYCKHRKGKRGQPSLGGTPGRASLQRQLGSSGIVLVAAGKHCRTTLQDVFAAAGDRNGTAAAPDAHMQ